MHPATNYIVNIIGNSPSVREALKSIVYFKNASDNLIELITRYGKIVKLRKLETIIKEGEFDQWVYIILEGSLDVFIGEQKIDNIVHSLVGEKCIFGEPRKASLKAGQTGAILLGVDMAILDALQNNNGSEVNSNDIMSCVELVSTISAVVYSRLGQICIYQLGKKKILLDYFCSELKQNIVIELFRNGYLNKSEINDQIDFFLRSNYPDGRTCVDSEAMVVDTRRLCLLLLHEHKFLILERLVENVFYILKPDALKAFRKDLDEVELKDFRSISLKCRDIFRNFVKEPDKLMNEWFSNVYEVADNGVINLFDMCLRVDKGYGLNPKTQLAAILKILELFAGLNAEFNSKTMQLLKLLNKLTLKELKANSVDYHDPLNFSLQADEFISMSNFREALINPYLKALGQDKDEPVTHEEPEKKPELPKAKEDDAGGDTKKFNQSDIDSLFDQFN